MTAEVKPEVPIRMITPKDVRDSIGRAKRSLEKAADEIIWQIEMESWRTLGYTSWKAMREAEYGGAAFMVPSKNRPELVSRMKAIEVGTTARGGPKHLTDQEIAKTAGVSKATVENDMGTRNKTRKSTDFVEPEPDDDVIDAEIVEDDEPATFATGESIPTSEVTTGPATAEPATTTCPTCHGTGKVTR